MSKKRVHFPDLRPHLRLSYNHAAVKHFMQTPTFALTTLGFTGLLLQPTRFAAFVALTFTGIGGCAMALSSEVRDKGQEWGWIGLTRALRNPTREFYRAFGIHLAQALVAGAIAMSWYRRCTESERKLKGC